MARDEKNVPSFDDLVFEHRNKEYGAYRIRKSYHRVVLISTLIGVFTMIMAVEIPYIRAKSEKQRAVKASRDTVVAVFSKLQEAPPPPPPPPPPKQPPGQQAALKYVPPVIVRDSIPNQPMPVMPTPEESPTDKPVTEYQPFEPVKTPEVPKEEREEEVFVVVEEMPEFPGGQTALMQYLSQAIKYPAVAQENGVQGRVFVSFTINKDGSISNAKVTRGVDPALDAEALRVVNSMPKWKPGKQRGVPVRVTYSVPIRFVLQN